MQIKGDLKERWWFVVGATLGINNVKSFMVSKIDCSNVPND
jgi:hypothetical protein